ncbi:Regulator of chromosome condensation (RCC1) repeat protein [compost metagenome]
MGQLGIGTTADKSTPVAVGSDTWSAVAVGTKHILGIRTTGAAFGWGAGTYGQIGNSAATHRSSPVQIGSLTDWKKIWSGGNGSMGTR